MTGNGEVFDALLRLSPRWTVTGQSGGALMATRQRGSETLVVCRHSIPELVDRLLEIEHAEAAAERAEAEARAREAQQ